MLKNPLLRYLIRRDSPSLLQVSLTSLAICGTIFPMTLLFFLVDWEEALQIIIVIEALVCFPVLLLFPFAMAFVGANLITATKRLIGPFDLLRATLLTDKDILNAFMLTAFFRMWVLLILAVIGMGTGIIAFQLGDDYRAGLFGILLYTGLCLLNPMAALAGITIGLWIQQVQIASAIAIFLTFALMLLTGTGFWLYVIQPIFNDEESLETWGYMGFFCIVPTLLVLNSAYRLALDFIRHPGDW